MAQQTALKRIDERLSNITKKIDEILQILKENRELNTQRINQKYQLYNSSKLRRSHRDQIPMTYHRQNLMHESEKLALKIQQSEQEWASVSLLGKQTN